MTLIDSLKEEYVRTGVAVADKRSLLADIASIAKASPVLQSVAENDILQALMERETLGSTGFEKGLAIPHCRLKDISGFVVGLVTVPDGVDFSSIDGSPTRICFFIIGPAALPNEYMRVLSMIARTCSIPGVIDKILAASGPSRARELFLESVPAKIRMNQEEEKSLVTVFVQVEDAFMDILQIVASSPDASVSVVEASDPASHLHKLPLFATFWTSEENRFQRIITGVVNRKLTNELVREINVVADSKGAKQGVMVIVQDIGFSTGSLKA
jgi:PTS system nitrogen regulatory IIA component